MDTHEKGLAEEKRLRTSAAIQEEFTEKKEEKNRKRKAQENASLLGMYGYDKEAQAYWLATGEEGLKTGLELGKLSLKNNVDPNTLIKSPSFDGSPNSVKDAKNIVVDTEKENNTLTQTERVFTDRLDRSNISALYAPDVKSLTSAVQYANAIQAEINAKTDIDKIKAIKTSEYWLDAMQAEAEAKRKPEKTDDAGLANTKITANIHYKHKESYLKQAGFATDLQGKIKQITEGRLGVAGVAYVNAAFASRYVNTHKSDGTPIDTVFESIVDTTLQNAESIFDRHVDYSTANDDFTGGKIFSDIKTAQQFADKEFAKNAEGQVFRFYGTDTDTGTYGIYTAAYVGREFYENTGHKFYLSLFDEVQKLNSGN
tara:strand:- start:811 stop:1923 length:1113 start_codon:yes stop_codon:yes gene_type:complete